MAKVRAFWCDARGATSIEYAIIGFFLSILIVAGATAIGTKLNARISPINNGLS